MHYQIQYLLWRYDPYTDRRRQELMSNLGEWITDPWEAVGTVLNDRSVRAVEIGISVSVRIGAHMLLLKRIDPTVLVNFLASGNELMIEYPGWFGMELIKVLPIETVAHR